MESKFRPIPLTILDFMGALLPGFVWLLLIVATFHVFFDESRPGVVPPLAAWQDIIALTAKADALLAAFLLTVVSLMIGYALKPLSMGLAGLLVKHIPKIDSETRHIRPFDFPYNAYFKEKFRDATAQTDFDADKKASGDGKENSGGDKVEKEQAQFYKRVVELLEKRLSCSPEQMPGNAPFGAAKRYLRLAAPALWEESERMEAEVRMVGMLFLAAAYSLLLSLIVLFWRAFGGAPGGGTYGGTYTLSWTVASFVAAVIFMEGFNRARIREVGYTYVNTLVAMSCSPPQSAHAPRAGSSPDDGGE